MRATDRIKRKRLLVVGLVIPIALFHFFTGSNYRGPYPVFVNGYLLDILVPFALYFLLCVKEFSLLRYWFIKSILVFTVGASVEVAQFYGAPIFGRTFDPVDFLMYGLGVIFAAFLDVIAFPRIFKFWTLKAVESTQSI